MNSKKKKQPAPPTLEGFIGTAQLDLNGGYIWGVDKKGGMQMLAEVRGWGAIQNLFEDQDIAGKFQDNLGQFIVDAINEKIAGPMPDIKDTNDGWDEADCEYADKFGVGSWQHKIDYLKSKYNLTKK